MLVIDKVLSKRNIATSPSGIRVFFLFFAITIGSVHTWAAITSSSMNPDGIAYLDIGDAYLRGDWANAINPTWSPLYSWILGLVLYLVQPSMEWEFPTVHLVNFAIFLLALISFFFFWRQLSQYRQQTTLDSDVTIPNWAWLSIGYILFIWVTLSLINIWAVTPDMLMAVFVLIAAGLVVRIRQNSNKISPYILLGSVLGFGYLAKTIMFPLAFVFLWIVLFTPGNLRLAAPRTAIALLIFLLIALPYVALISNVHNGFTIGEAGTLTYLRCVNNIPCPHWQGEPESFGAPLHSSRLI